MFWISILLAGLFLYLALRDIDFASFTSALRNANYVYLPVIFIWGSLTSWIRAYRWRILLTAGKSIPTKNVFWANMAGYLGNNILPARAGEFIRAVYVGKENNISTSFSLATGLVERFMDLIALVILGSISLANLGILSAPLQSALKVMSVIAVLGFLGILIAPYIGQGLIHFGLRIPFLSEPTKKKIVDFLEQFLRGIKALHHPMRAATFVLATCVIWTMDGIGVIILARSLQLYLTLFQSFLLLTGLGLSSAIPSTPGYVGIYQFVAVIILQPFGISSANALAFIIFLQVTNLSVIVAWGSIAALRTSKIVQHQTG